MNGAKGRGEGEGNQWEDAEKEKEEVEEEEREREKKWKEGNSLIMLPLVPHRWRKDREESILIAPPSAHTFFFSLLLLFLLPLLPSLLSVSFFLIQMKIFFFVTRFNLILCSISDKSLPENYLFVECAGP